MKKTLIFLLLCIVGFIVAVLADGDVNPTSLLIYHDTVRLQGAPILPGHTVRGEFLATENNLAIVRVRLRTYNRFNTTHIVFQLKRKDDSGWLVTNTYTLDRIADGLLYPMGFTPIPDSKGNIYYFEISSPDGTTDNAVGVAGGYHGVAAQYVQPLPGFMPKKVMSTMRDPFSILYFSMFFVPAGIYLFRKYRLHLFMYLLMVYTYLPVSVYSNTILFFAATQLFVGNAFLVGLLLLVQIPIVIAFGNILAANRLASLTFFSLVTGVIIAIRDLKKR